MALGDAAIAAENARYLALPKAEREAMARDHATWGVLILKAIMPVQWDAHVMAKLDEIRGAS